MMDWFIEDSTPLLVIGALVEALLVFALVQTGRPKLLYAMVGTALLVGGLVWHEKHTVTDKKRIDAVLHDAAAAVERNDPAGVQDCISPGATDLRAQVPRVLSQFKFNEVVITGLTIKVNRFNNPPSAIAEFMVRVNGSDKAGNFPYNNLLERLKVTLLLENDRWLVSAYDANGPGAEAAR